MRILNLLMEMMGPAVSSMSEIPKRIKGPAIKTMIVYKIDHQRYRAAILPIQRDPWTTGYRVMGMMKKKTIPKELNMT